MLLFSSSSSSSSFQKREKKKRSITIVKLLLFLFGVVFLCSRVVFEPVFLLKSVTPEEEKRVLGVPRRYEKNTFMLKRRWRDEDDDAERVDKLLVSSLRRLSKEDQYYREEEKPPEKKKRVQQLDDKSGTQGVFAREICLFAPSTLDRLKSVLPRLAQTWSGTMSVAVLASEEDVRREIFGTSTREFTRNRLTVIAVDPLPEYETRFPVNALRNLALSGCKRTLNATYVVLHDVDFEIFPNAPSKELLEEIEEVLKPNAKHGLVLPSFTADDRYLRRVETFRKEHDFSRESLDVLNSFNRKEKLVELIKEYGIVESFREKYWPVAHAATNVSKWLSMIIAEKKKDAEKHRPYSVGANHLGSRHPYYYEPWIILRADVDDMPAFDESFVTYGFNKISWIHELSADGYKLFVSLSSWMVHTNIHPNRGSQTSGEMLQRCKNTANTGKDFRISRIGHSCIPKFLKRIECAYNFGLERVQWPTSNDSVPERYLVDTMRNESRIACFGGCVTDQEPVPRTPPLAVLQGYGGRVTKRVGEKPPRRRREKCERLRPSSSATWTL